MRMIDDCDRLALGTRMKTALTTTTKLRDLDVVVWLHTAVDPAPDEWAVGVEMTVELIRKHGGDISLIRSLVVTDGGAPNARQRKELHEVVFGGRPSQLSVITNSLTNPLKRGVATAIHWLNPAFLALPPAQWRESLRHLDLEDDTVPLLQVLNRLQKYFPFVRSLSELEQAVGATIDASAC
jgi:hypothetical protein